MNQGAPKNQMRQIYEYEFCLIRNCQLVKVRGHDEVAVFSSQDSRGRFVFILELGDLV